MMRSKLTINRYSVNDAGHLMYWCTLRTGLEKMDCNLSYIYIKPAPYH